MIEVRPLAGLIELLDTWYDPALAEDWDAVGLVTGDPADRVQRIHVAVDPTEAVAAEAVAAGTDLLVVHHPLFLRGTHGVPATTAGGRVVRSLLRGGCALFVAHTNADSARPGVSDALLSAVGVRTPGEVLRPSVAVPQRSAGAALHGLVVHVPVEAAEAVLDAVTAEGGGRLGSYDRCAFAVDGLGTFRPLAGSRPFVGSEGEVTRVAERRLELVVPDGSLAAVVSALLAAHPYETPSYWTWPLTSGGPAPSGLGRVGDLDEPMTLGGFAAAVARALPDTVGGVRSSGDPSAVVRRVAVCGGSGSDLVPAARAAGADVLVTSDTRHHTASDAGLAIVDVAHWAGEWPWTRSLADRLREVVGEANVSVSTLRTDPWTLHTAAE